MGARYDNETFFATAGAPRPPPTVPEHVFFAGRARPPAEMPIAVRAALTPMRFAVVIFLVGWAGILFQSSFLQQVVFGAPVFEELAKFGPPLLLALMLRARSLWIRLPLAWASGASFGVMEHFVTYAEEDVYTYGGRIVFHGASAGVSMLFYTAFERLPDVRARWASMVPAMLFHWANNFMAVALGLGSLVLPLGGDVVGLGIAALVTGGLLALTLAALLAWDAFARQAREVLATAMPRLGLDDAVADAALPRTGVPHARPE